MLNYEVIKETIKQANEDGETEGYCFYAVISASISDKILLGSLAAFATKFFLVNVTDKKIHLFALDMMGDVKNHVFIPFKEIKQVRISKWMFGLGRKINVQLIDGSKIHLKAKNNSFVIKDQKRNLLGVEKTLQKE